MDLDKISSQFSSLKDIDTAQLGKALSEHQNTVIKIGLIIGSLVLVVLMFIDFSHKQAVLRSQISQEHQKLDALKQRDASVVDLDNFKAALPKKMNEFELISLLSNYANSYHITMPSLSPAESQDLGLNDVINVNFDAVSDNFKDMMLFLRSIERSGYPLMINTWSGSELQNGTIAFTMQVSLVLIHTT